MSARLLTTLVLLFAGNAALAANDCALAQRYVGLARERIASGATDDAQDFLSKSIAECPSYDAYEQLAELAAQSTEEADKVRAADAFVSAHELAPTDASRAHTLFRYAQLLNRDGDPQNAYPLIKAARTLDARSADIAELERTIEEQIRNPTKDQLVRGLRSSINRPLNLPAATPVSAVALTTVLKPSRTTVPSGGAVNIQINFVSASTVVDEETRPNVAKLVEALHDPAFAKDSFVFVGHADARGDEQMNMALSWARAEAIYKEVLQIDPSLKGRVEVNGRGEYDLLDRGYDDNAHRANRRLQVLLKK